MEEGWAGDFDELLAEALRRYLESHSSRLVQSFIREDASWGVERPRVSADRDCGGVKLKCDYESV